MALVQLGRFHSPARPVRIRWPGRIGSCDPGPINSSNGKTLAAVRRRPRAVAAPVIAPAIHDRRSKARPPFSLILGLAPQGDARFIMKDGQEAFNLAAVDHRSGAPLRPPSQPNGSARPPFSVSQQKLRRSEPNGPQIGVAFGRLQMIDPSPSSLETPITGDAKADGSGGSSDRGGEEMGC
ncbi:hypothetical protein GQ457_02G022570 [Hibiscus cannabinus]